MLSRKVVCSISGGVDSAVAALLLKRKGYDVLGVFMRNWDIRDETGVCGNDEDCKYAKKVCSKLDIPFHEVNLVKEYWNDVFQPAVDQYQNNRTPNPDVVCNRFIKFGVFHKKCQHIAGDISVVVATGHYARTSLGENVLSRPSISAEPVLLKAVDEFKDQTFFLHKVPIDALTRTYFPIGDLHKSEVKAIAARSEVAFTLERKESMGICFIGKRSFGHFLSNYIPPSPGRFISYETGQVVGEHQGHFLYTFGQRSRISGKDVCHVIVHKDTKSGDIYVARGAQHPLLYSRSLVTGPVHWTSGFPMHLAKDAELRCQFRFCHGSPLVNCDVHRLDDGRSLIVLDHALRGITPGQDAVLYFEEQCLGGGTIEHVGPSAHESRNGEVDFAFFREDSELWRRLIDTYGDQIFAFQEDYWSMERHVTLLRTTGGARDAMKRR